MNTTTQEQLTLFCEDERILKDKTSSTFSNNMSLPVHRWFRYSAGFSAEWVRSVINKNPNNHNVLDPFAGSGTVLIEAENSGINSKGIEAHPFVYRVAKAKLLWKENADEFLEYGESLLNNAKYEVANVDGYPSLIRKCFPDDTLSRLDKLKTAWTKKEKTSMSELAWLALASILRECSPVGTAQWQYILPNKKKARINDPYVAFETKIRLMYQDMKLQQKKIRVGETDLFNEDARDCNSIPDKWADLVVTSPPYANNYDYADATRLEMSFFGEINNWGDLQNTVRQYLVRSCTQHVARDADDIKKFLTDPLLKSIQDEIIEACEKLEHERENHRGKKPYHAMITAYFFDMAKVWVALRKVTNQESRVCFVVGDSAPYGVYIPVDKWMGELALAAGFKTYKFDKTRDRNIKWKNRKHTVPLHEGRLWVAG